MQQVVLELREDYEFFCPITGEQMVCAEAPFEPSPATVFCYLEHIGEFEYASDWAQSTFKKCLSLVNEEVRFKNSEAFEMLIGQETENEKNLICFSITTNGMACGPASSIVHFCIDMGYKKEFTSNIK
jgi:hypothetical protein